nr:MAG TPA: hypothetical protein [Bacteriophage sp.]
MSNLVRDNKVLARKVLRDIKKWLSHSEIQLYGRDVHTYFQTDFYKMNTMYKGYSHIYVHTLPDDSFITIEDKDRVLIGVDFDKVLYKDNLYIADYRGTSLGDSLYSLATSYFNTVMSDIKIGDGDYIKLLKEFKDMFGFVINTGNTGNIGNTGNTDNIDELVSLLGMYNKSTPELSDERDRLLDCIARYLDKQLDTAVNDLLSRMYILGAEIQDRDRVLLLANLDFKKNRFTMYNSIVTSPKWKILKGAKNNPMSFDLSELVKSKGNFKTRHIKIEFNFRNVDEYKDNTLYLI